ncbi:YbjQ family protein [Crocinitomicaceae bacterium]|nr:YbjQ family protein [Crocinitomicaceae bacterium]MDC1244087.1 YbjQ family protein [Crocinitomicaceae bacterium]MDC1361567.1 YbjQ family protein [Crocinitomicaceae bacterium]
MILSTIETVPKREVIEILGIARGSTVRARNVGRDIFAGIKNIVGGEISEYTKLQAQSREQAMQRMIDDAKSLNADAIVNIRFTTTMVMQGASEILAYGTAVKLG